MLDLFSAMQAFRAANARQVANADVCRSMARPAVAHLTMRRLFACQHDHRNGKGQSATT
jgi:hypothetical protein